MLIARRDMLDAGLAGCDSVTVRERVGTLRSVMGSQQLGPEAMQLAKAAFVSVLGRYPAWAVSEACDRFLDGRAGNGSFAPTPAEIATVCRMLTADALHERAVINSILDAEVYAVPSEEDRRKVEEMHAAFVAEAVQRAAKTNADNRRDGAPVTTTGSASAARQQALAELADRKAKREAEEHSSLASQLQAGREPFETERKGEAA